MSVGIYDFIAEWSRSPFVNADDLPWNVTQNAERHIREAQTALGPEYRMECEVAVHVSAVIEPATQLKGPIIIGPDCFIASGAYLRGGVYLQKECIIGPNTELKTSFMFRGSKLAHLNFVGDSIVGSGVNVEAGAIVANYRNEFDDKTIRIGFEDDVFETSVEKFGAVIGDRTKIGANAVVAPGALLRKDSNVGRLELVDQYPTNRSP